MKKFSKAMASVLACVIFAGVFSGCSTPPPSGQQSETQGSGSEAAGSSGASVRDDIIFSINADIVSLDTHAQKDTVSGIISEQMYDSLIYKDSNGDLTPALATDWAFGADNTEVTFTIRPDVKFHNGDVMTAEDVAFSINRAVANGMTSNVSNAIDRAEIVDDSHVKIILKYAFGPILQCIASTNMSVVSKKVVDELGDDGFANAPVGTGPYKFVEWKNGEKITMESFDEYWRGTPPIKHLTFLIMTDKNTAAIALQNNEIDVLYDPDAADKMQLSSLSNVTYSELEKSNYFFMVSFNTQEGVFSDLKVRQAVALGLNREEMLIGALNGDGMVVTCPIVPTSGMYDSSYEFYPQNIEKAKELLTEAGYPDGLTATIKLNQSSLYVKPAEVFQAQMRKIGINLEFELMERATYLEEIYDNLNYDITLYMFSSIYNDPDYIFYGRLFSENIGTTNYANYNNPAVDSLIMDARVEADENKRAELYKQISDAVKEDVPFVPLMVGVSAIAYNKDLKGVVPSPYNLFFVYDYSWE